MKLNVLGDDKLHKHSSLCGYEEAALNLTGTHCFDEKKAILAALVSLVACTAIGLGLSTVVKSANLIHYGIPTAVVLSAGVGRRAGVEKKALAITDPSPLPKKPPEQKEIGSIGNPYNGL